MPMPTMVRPGDREQGTGVRFPRKPQTQEETRRRQPPAGLATSTTRSAPPTPRCASGRSSG